MNYMNPNTVIKSLKCIQYIMGLLCLFGLILLPKFSTAQTINKLYQQFTEGWEIKQTKDQGYVVMGRSGDVVDIETNDIVLFKIDPDGTLLWSQSYGGNDLEQAFELVETSDEGFVMAGISSSFSGGATDVVLYKTDKNGNELWQKKFGDPTKPDQANDIIQTTDRSAFITVGCFDCPRNNPSTGVYDTYVIKTDVLGNLIWSRTFGESDKYEEALGVIETADGQFLVFGTIIDEAENEDLYLLKIDGDGNELWTKTYGTPSKENASAIVRTPDGNFLLGATSYAFDILGQQPDGWVLKVDDDGEVIWNKNYGGAGGDLLYDLINTVDGGFAFIGVTWSYGNEDGDFYLVKLDESGNEQWVSATGGAGEQQGKSLSQTSDGRFALTGISNAADFSLEVIVVDALGQLNSNTITGTVFHDVSKDCMRQNNEPGLANWIIKASGEKDFYGTTDAAGNYEIIVEEGNYVISIMSPSDYFVACQGSYFVELPESFTNAEVNFQMQPDIYCADLEIDISTPALSPCKLNTYTVNYKNKGVTDAFFAYAEIQLDDQLQFISGTADLSNLGNNLYRFDLGTIPAGTSGHFEIRTQLSCDAKAGQTHCIEAHIFPDKNCNPLDPAWDQSHLEVDVNCKADTVVFSISNAGENTQNPIQYLVVEDDVVVWLDNTTVEGMLAQIKKYKTKASDKTYRIFARQAAGHPGRSMPTIAIEACESDGDGNFSLGYVTQYPDDDADPFRSVDCQENIGGLTNVAYANMGFPKGRKQEKFIQPDTDIEYLIRFQNTGTNSLSRVVIRDTLSRFLDPATLRAGAGSHPFEYEVYGDGILKVSFDDIELPASVVNEERSRGFVKFRVRQQMDNTPGTLVENKATIYIDDETPVLTPTEFHTIETKTEYLRADVQLCENQAHSGQYYQEDTLVYDTTSYQNYDEISLSFLTILENSYSEIDTLMASGALYNNVAYYNDTTITHIISASNFCDSIMTVNIIMSPTTTTDISELALIRLSPNPTSDHTILTFDLTASAKLKVSLINLLGQELQQIIPNDFLQQGLHRIPINSAGLSPGTYHILFQSEQGSTVRKFVKLQ